MDSFGGEFDFGDDFGDDFNTDFGGGFEGDDEFDLVYQQEELGDPFEYDDYYEPDFQPSFLEQQQVSVLGAQLDPRDKKDAFMIEFYNDLLRYDIEQSDIPPILEDTRDIEHFRYFNPLYLASAYYYKMVYGKLQKQSITAFVEKYNLNCPSLVRYVKIISE